jgi:hypothetical protein
MSYETLEPVGIVLCKFLCNYVSKYSLFVSSKRVGLIRNITEVLGFLHFFLVNSVEFKVGYGCLCISFTILSNMKLMLRSRFDCLRFSALTIGAWMLSFGWSPRSIAAGYCDGSLKNGTLQGKHDCRFPSGIRYEGEWVAGVRQGRGTVTYPDGTRCEGSFKDNTLTGNGVCKYSSGNRYEGGFEKDVRQGRGVFVYANGTRCEGVFKDDAIAGVGICLFPSGNRYEGGFWQNEPMGLGTLSYGNGVVCTGNFQRGKIVGLAQCALPGGDRYEGNLNNGQFDGMGAYTYRDGSKVEGRWRDGQLISP